MVYEYIVNIYQTHFFAIFHISQAMTISIDIPIA